MNCGQMEQHAIAYLDGKMAHREADAVGRHLAVCTRCAERLRAVSEVSSLLDDWKPVRPSASFNARLQQRILTEPAGGSGWLDRFWLWLPANSFGKPAMTGALLGLMVMAVALARYSPGTSLSSGSAETNTATVATTFDGNDELALYRDLAVLENLELLSNFEVLQELQTSTP